MMPRSRQSHDVASMRWLLASLALDIKFLKFQRALYHKHWSEQPRAPSGQPTGGQWVSLPNDTTAKPNVNEDDTRIHSNYRQTAETRQEYISANCPGKINREFPKQFLDIDVSDLIAASQANEPGAKKSYKLLFDKRILK